MLSNEKWNLPIVMPELEPWRQELLNAADYMERHGQCHYDLEDRHGRVCYLGALVRTRTQARKRSLRFVWHSLRAAFSQANRHCDAYCRKIYGAAGAIAFNDCVSGATMIRAMRDCAKHGG